MNRHRPLPAWWDAAEHAARTLTRPRADTTRLDAELESLLRASALLAFGRSAIDAVDRAWPASRTAVFVRAIARERSVDPLAVRLRTFGIMAVAGGLTAAALQLVASPSLPVVGYLMPATAAVAGATVLLAAVPLARAISHRSA